VRRAGRLPDAVRDRLPDELIDELLAGRCGEAEIMGPSGLLGDLTRRLIERAMAGELTGHLGYEPEAAADVRPTNLTAQVWASPANASKAHRLLVRCVADPRAAAALPSGQALAHLFPDALTRRAAEHIRTHAADPAAALPDDDHELVSFITGLLTAPIAAGNEG
jgi:hypothetical protein